jgi:hypothetical protein
MAIIAALSVVYENFGIKRFHLLFSASFVRVSLSPEFADTPPAIAISRIPVSLAALFSLPSRISIMVKIEKRSL